MSRNRILNLTFQVAVWGAVLMAGCRQAAPKKTSWEVSLDEEQHAPYGTSLVYKTLPYYFPAARSEPLPHAFRYTSIDEPMRIHGDSAGLLVMIGLQCYVSDAELNSLLSFARAGNEVLICSGYLDAKLEQLLHCDQQNGGYEEYPINNPADGLKNRNALHLMPDSGKTYGYNGRWLQSYYELPKDRPLITGADSLAESADPESGESVPYEKQLPGIRGEVLGFNKYGPDFIRYAVGDGHISLHAAPLAFSNYFLLQEGNRAYLDGIWHSFPANISHIYWNGYYKRKAEGSHFGILWEYPATRWALILALGTLFLYVLMGLRRRQRIIPVLPPVENASVSFVETVGRLYFNKGNHANLAEKMIQHFLEWVRTSYFLDTNQLNQTFVQQLAARTGQPEARVQDLVQRIHDIRLGQIAVSGPYLYELHQLIQHFYPTHRS